VTSVADSALFDAVAGEAATESPLWAGALLPAGERDTTAVFSTLVVEPQLALGVETIYEGYLAHYGRPRLFVPSDEDTALLLGDYLYAHGLVHVARTGNVDAVADLAELISLCAQGRGDRRPGDGAAWAATAACLGGGTLDAGRAALRDAGDAGPLEALARAVAGDDAVDAALAAHDLRVR
jgi:hypothetical protein